MSKKRLSILIFKLFIFAVILIAFFFRLSPQYEHYYSASLIGRMERLDSIEGPKVVLIGNSNLAFGINSKMIEEKFGMPVVNMGFHGSLGNAFHEEMAKINITPGDIYVICHTSYSDEDKIDDPVVAWLTIEDHVGLWRVIRMQDVYDMLKAYPVYLKRVIDLWSKNAGNVLIKDSAYSREAFNAYGDVVYDRANDHREKVDELVPEINEVCVNRINKLTAYLRERGADLVIAGYPIIVDREPTEQFKEQIGKFEQKLREECDCSVISDYQDYFFDQDLFCDFVYHMNGEGADLRTQQLIMDLEEYLD